MGAVTVGGVGTINQVNGYFKDAGGELEPNIFTFPTPRNPLDRGDHRPETYGGTPGAIPPGIPPTDLTPYNYPQLFPGNVAPPNDHHVPVFNSDNQEDDGRRDGAGKNGQHGRPAPPALQEQLDNYKEQLGDLKANQGSKKEKDDLAKKINNIQRKIDQMPKGQNHSMKAKGTGGGQSR